MIEQELLNFLTNQGVAIAFAVYLLITRDKIISKNTQAINNLVGAIEVLKERNQKK